MSTAVDIFEQKLPVTRGYGQMVPAPISSRSGMLPAALPAMYPEAVRFDRIPAERLTGNYGPDARIIFTISPGLIVDTYA